MKEIQIAGLTIKYTENCFTIYKSYQIKKKKDMIKILVAFLIISQYNLRKRDLTSLIQEWKSHNRLYRLGILRKHTGDCDFEENEKWYRLIGYKILGI